MRPATSRINRCVSSLTGPLPFNTLETVATDIFASRATSLIVTILLAAKRPGLGSLGGEWGEVRLARLQAISRYNATICNRLHRGRQTPPHVCHPGACGRPISGLHTLPT